MGKRILAVKQFIANKTIWKRSLITLGIIGAMSAVILMDHSCDFKNLTCDSKSKVNIEIKRGSQ